MQSINRPHLGGRTIGLFLLLFPLFFIISAWGSISTLVFQPGRVVIVADAADSGPAALRTA